ncbi:stage VI sporulation protein F [Longirhabdus pacifica]|uniref:stage VI sporulation protein F n=1 Tax=Longirhabdus pacifica TaxID=2305227 RepID=UPI001008D67B|nr:stage VI sporulation protein F [Longirhabdus pacifica]
MPQRPQRQQRDLSKEVLKKVKKNTGKNVSSKEINKLASTVKPSTMKNEDQLMKLIDQVSSLVNIPVSDKTKNDIVKAVKASDLDGGHLEKLIGRMIGK